MDMKIFQVTYLRKNFSGYGDGNKVSEAWSDSSISKNGVIYVIFCFLAWQLVNY